jgi:4'-phosphopantetheinyl transferase
MPADGEVQLWLCDLDGLDRASLEQNAALLDQGEVARRAAYVRQEDRDRFLVGRVLARRALGHCLGIAPAALAFATGPYGRPYLAVPEAFAGLAGCAKPLHFNLSHSGALVALAVARQPEVGVDVERLSRHADLDGIAESVFTPSEQAALATVPEPERHRRFFRLWTLKEAYSKAMGMGLALDFKSFGVVPEAGDRAVLVLPPGEDADAWTLHSPQVRPGYILSLAVRRRGQPVSVQGPLDGNALLRQDSTTGS